MKTKFLFTLTTLLLIFTISALGLTILKAQIVFFPFAVLGTVLTIIFIKQLDLTKL